MLRRVSTFLALNWKNGQLRCMTDLGKKRVAEDVHSHPQKKPRTMKLDTPEFHSIFTQELRDLASIFQRHGYEIRVAGGAVRDLLSGIKPADLDFATTATPDQMKSMFEAEAIRMINTKGEKHGTITARMNDKENFEVTTLRIDVLTDGRHAEVEFTHDWHLDANRRDLTVNSMFLGLDGTVYDYFGGVEDLKQRRVAFVGDASTRIREDYLRILRYFRFYGRISKEADTHEESTLQAIRENVDGLQRISGERIWSEMKKILVGNYGADLMLRMLDVGVAPYVGLPENVNKTEFKAAWDRSRPMNPLSITPLVGLMENPEQVLELHKRLKLSAVERDTALFVASHRTTASSESDLLKPYYFLIFNVKMSSPPQVKQMCCEILKYKGEADLYKKLMLWQPPRLPINGQMLKERNVPGGKPMSKVTNYLRNKWIAADFQPTADELLALIPEALASESPPPAKKYKF